MTNRQVGGIAALTGIAGVIVLATSSLPLLRDFGIVVAVNVAAALLSALVILPPMLVWADRRGWVTYGILRPERTTEPRPQPAETLSR